MRGAHKKERALSDWNARTNRHLEPARTGEAPKTQGCTPKSRLASERLRHHRATSRRNTQTQKKGCTPRSLLSKAAAPQSDLRDNKGCTLRGPASGCRLRHFKKAARAPARHLNHRELNAQPRFTTGFTQLLATCVFPQSAGKVLRPLYTWPRVTPKTARQLCAAIGFHGPSCSGAGRARKG